MAGSTGFPLDCPSAKVIGPKVGSEATVDSGISVGRGVSVGVGVSVMVGVGVTVSEASLSQYRLSWVLQPSWWQRFPPRISQICQPLVGQTQERAILDTT